MTQTRPNTGRTCHPVTLTLPLSALYSCLCLLFLRFNRNPGGMAGLATSASISSFITWSACSSHRSLNGIRTLTTYAGARKTLPPNRRLLDRTVTATGPSQIHRVCIPISCVSPSETADLRWQPATLPRFNTRVGAQGPVSSSGCQKGCDCSRNKEDLFLRTSCITIPKFTTRTLLTRQKARS